MSERRMPEDGDYYYFVSTCGNALSDCFTKTDDKHLYRFVHGNCFKTIQEAASAGIKVRELMLSLHGEPTTDCRQLPKLTTEVFDREDCPPWARYAALGGGGGLSFYEDKPRMSKDEYPSRWINYDRWYPVEGTKFDASDWKNSLIERPERLPDWYKFGVVGWHKRAGYFTVCADDELAQRISIQQIDDKSRGWLSYETLCKEVKQARIRPYNEDEMKALVGKVLKHSTGVYLVTAFEDRWGQVNIESVWREPSELAELWTQLDGKACGVYEHLNEKGEWVE